ncbi:hypothetical protein [Streptomyces sp. NPDC051776]|uniref:hypothetical protein n=1 Tax=Streptomyces sp. NPDC051776 TaxID=3155414 RepID=UPI003435F527
MTRPPARRITAGTLLALGCLTAAALPAATAQGAERLPHDTGKGLGRGCVVVWFDLGETLVHTAEDGSIRYMPGAATHLRALRARHIPVGLITNVPSSWGNTDAERAAELKKVVDKDWKDSRPFAWSDFGDRILTPRTEAERKPAAALWERARDTSRGCRLVYQAETNDEIRASSSLGFVSYLVGRPYWPAFMPVPLIAALGHLPRRL